MTVHRINPKKLPSPALSQLPLLPSWSHRNLPRF